MALAAEGRSRVTLVELALYFTAPLLTHVQRGKRQGTMRRSVFLRVPPRTCVVCWTQTAFMP